MIQKRIVVAGRGSAADGCEIYFADGTHGFISSSDIFGDEYEEATVEGTPPSNWAINIPVSDSEADTNIENVTFIPSDELYDDEENQMATRILVRVGGNRVNLFGVYIEEVSCVNGSPVVQFYKIG